VRLDEVKTVGVLGGGVMGGGIAQVLAVAGYDVWIRDMTPEILEHTREVIVETRFGLRRAVELGKLPEDQLDKVTSRLAFTTEVSEMKAVDFVIEAVPERLELKQQVFAELDQVIKPEAILVSNTSGFPITDIGRDVSAGRQALLAGMHFASPVPAMKMCEVVYTERTSPETIDAVRGVAERMGKVVSMVRDAPGTYGFILNRVFAAARREADKIVADGIASREDVDKAMMTGRNWPVGFYNSRGVRTGWLD
jgi:3-hydroxybutyryl-CoA dehydrogenase